MVDDGQGNLTHIAAGRTLHQIELARKDEVSGLGNFPGVENLLHFGDDRGFALGAEHLSSHHTSVLLKNHHMNLTVNPFRL